MQEENEGRSLQCNWGRKSLQRFFLLDNIEKATLWFGSAF